MSHSTIDAPQNLTRDNEVRDLQILESTIDRVEQLADRIERLADMLSEDYEVPALPYELGFELGWEGTPVPSASGLSALGLDQDTASAFFLGWQAGVDIASSMIQEANVV